MHPLTPSAVPLRYLLLHLLSAKKRVVSQEVRASREESLLLAPNGEREEKRCDPGDRPCPSKKVENEVYTFGAAKRPWGVARKSPSSLR